VIRKVIYHAQTTVDGRLARADGELWDHFPWGETEIGHVNGFFRQTDTWVLGRKMHDVIVPFWSEVAAGRHEGDLDTASLEFGRIFGGLRIAVFSRTLDDDPARTVLRGDPAAELAALKEEEGSDIMLSCGPALLAELTGVVDAYLLAISPVVLGGGKRVFDDVRQELPLRLTHSQVFDGGAVVLRYEL
jgi:dihydrofolate reductase